MKRKAEEISELEAKIAKLEKRLEELKENKYENELKDCYEEGGFVIGADEIESAYEAFLEWEIRIGFTLEGYKHR